MEEKVRLAVTLMAIWFQGTSEDGGAGLGSILFLLLFVASAIAGTIWLVRRRNPEIQFTNADKEDAAGNKLMAYKLFKRVRDLLESSKATAAKYPGLLGKACLRLGLLDQSAGRRQEAFAFYKKARKCGTELPPAAFNLLTECHAQASDAGEETLQLYLKYIVSGPRSGEAANRVFTVLQGMGRVAEDMKSGPRKAAAEINRRVLAANPSFEWAHYYLGLAHLLDGRTTEARVCFQAAQKLNPERVLTFYWLGVCLLQQAEPDLDGAIAVIERFLKFPAPDAKHRKREAKACLELGKRLVQKVGGFDTKEDCSAGERQQTLARAVHYLSEGLGRQPEDAASHFFLGRVYSLQKDTPRMLAELERAAALAPTEKEYIFQLGVERNRAGDLPGAVAALKQAIDAGPEFGNTHALLGDILLRLGDHAGAESHLRSALRLREGDVASCAHLLLALFGQGRHQVVIQELESLPANTIRPHLHPEAAFAVGRSYLQTGKYLKAIEWLQGLKHSPQATYYLGCAYAHAGKLPEARSCFDNLAAGNSVFANAAFLQRGHLCWAEGAAAQSAEEYRKVLQRDQTNSGAHYGLGLLALVQADLDSAIAHLKRAVEVQPEDAHARLALGVAWERQGEVSEALASYRSISTSLPERGAAALRSAVLLCRGGNFDEALKYFGECAAQGDNSDTLLFYRATALAMSGRLEDAIRDWGKLMERHPSNERLQLNLARAYYRLGSQHLAAGRIQDALAVWEKYLGLHPSDDKTARQLGELHFRLAAAQLEGSHANFTGALEHLRAAFRADQTNDLYAFYAALCELRLGHPERCLAALASLKNANDLQDRILYHTALCLLQKGETEEAVRILTKLRFKPDGDYSVYAGWALANERLRHGRTEEALEILDSEIPELLQK
jgi:tetratricopeptide (TPR) repeat protein